MMRTILGAAMMAILVAVPAAGQDRADIDAKLRNMKVTLDFKGAPLATVVDYLREISGLNLFVDQAVVDMDINVTMKVQEISLKSVLSLILNPQGCEAIRQENVVHIMRSEDVLDRTVVLELYDVRDILHPIKDFPGVDLQLNDTSLGTGVMMGEVTESEPFPIEELIRAHCGNGQWDDGKTSVGLQNGLLMVRHRPEVHKQVRRMLNLLRAHK